MTGGRGLPVITEADAVLRAGLLATKLHCPSPPARGVTRARLDGRLAQGLALNRQLALISAPAGFGKTSCVSSWVQGLDDRLAAWLSLEAADDDPARFLPYFIAALQQLVPAAGEEIAGVLQAGELPPAEVISTALSNDLLKLEERAVLVLDDFHVIQDSFILTVLAQLLDSLPPQLHLVLISREDPPLPLARLRAHNRLTEIRVGELRFSDTEAASFLNEVLDLSLSEADVALLEEKTEGWIVGLQLAGLALKGQGGASLPPTDERTDPSRFIAALSGSHRFILDYLTEEVLDQQPQEIRRFLLQTAVLDRLTGELCDAVTGRADSHALLAQLTNANLFLVSLDGEGQWYRYHHLFADLLRSQQRALPEEERAELHRRASRWYASAGLSAEAIQHALAARDYARVVALLDRHVREMVMQGYAKTVHGWLQAIPEAWRSQSTRTNLAFAWMHLLRGAYAEAAPYLEQAETALAEAGGEEGASLQADWLVMSALARLMEGEAMESERLARQALAIAPEQDANARSLATFALASVLRLQEEVPAATEAYRKAMQLARTAENAVAEMLSTVGLAQMAFEHGQLNLAAEIAGPAVERLEGAGSLPPIGGVLYGMLADIHYQWLQLDEAWRHARRALQLSTLGGYQSGRVACRVLLARLAQAGGDLESAGRELQEVGDLVPAQLPDYVRQELVAQQVRLYLAREQPDAARLALQGEGVITEPLAWPTLTTGNRVSYAGGLITNSALRLLLVEGRAGRNQDSLERGIELADRLLAAATERGYLLVALETLLLRAQMRAIPGTGRQEEATADLVQALTLAEPEGIAGVFVEQGPPIIKALARLLADGRLGEGRADSAQRILAFAKAQLPDGVPGRAEALVEPLTGRELDVLRLMAEGLTYKEIAALLFISLNTVRFHVKGIYGKLGVNKRAQALAQARQHQIL